MTISKLLDSNNELLCPVCGFGHNHIGRVSIDAGGRDHRPEITELVIEIEGECGHRWQLIIEQHKGRLGLEARRYLIYPDFDKETTVSDN